MLTQNQIAKIQEFFSHDIVQSEINIDYEHVRLLHYYCINPSSIHALKYLWQTVDLLTESKESGKEKKYINEYKYSLIK